MPWFPLLTNPGFDDLSSRSLFHRIMFLQPLPSKTLALGVGGTSTTLMDGVVSKLINLVAFECTSRRVRGFKTTHIV